MADPNDQTTNTSMQATSSPAEAEPIPVLVSPATDGEFNTIRLGILPKGCFSMEDTHFQFDSSFVTPLGTTIDVDPLKKLLDRHKGFKLSIFGHTDPVGKDDYNKVLSGRRAQAMFGLLVRNVELWKDLYFHHDTQGKDTWGARAIQIMLNLVGPTPAGTADGKIGPKTKTALEDFENANNLPAKGFNAKEELSPDTFEALAKLYMDAICKDDDGNNFQLTPEDFIAQGKGKDGKADFQGCSEFNPLMVFSRDEKAFFDREENKDARNSENQVNRRTMLLLYPPETRIDPAKWPCPTVKEGISGCQKRFFANAKDRRSNLEARREHKDEKKQPDMIGTYACRFYDRQASDSPCERGEPVEALCFVFLKLFDDTFTKVLSDTEYTLRGLDKGFRVTAKTDADGVLKHENIPDDHYAIECKGAKEIVEPFYMSDKSEHDNNPWFMRIHGVDVRDPIKIRLYDPSGKKIPGAPCDVSVGDQRLPIQNADDEGFITLRNIELPATCSIAWGPKPQKGTKPALIFSLNMRLTDEEGDTESEARRKLNNLGFASGDFSENVTEFQEEYGHLSDPPLPVNGTLDDATMKVLRDVYSTCGDNLKKK